MDRITDVPGTGDPRPVLAGLLPGELESLFGSLKLPPFRARQIFAALAQGSPSFGDMTVLPRGLREELNSRFRLYSALPSARLEDRDGTVKLQLSLEDGPKIEAILLKARGRNRARYTACLSTQAGCASGCVFCKTGTLALARNLRAGEMVEEFLRLKALAQEDGGGIDNVVIMGMGEPLLNLGELRRALTVLTHPEGGALSPRRFTLSTCGIVRGIRDLADGGPGIGLALSLTTADEALRQRLMPIGAANPLGELKGALLYYQGKTRRRITLEAVLLSGINTRREDAKALAAFARGLDAAVNLIPWNPVEGLCFEGRPLREPAAGELLRFAGELEELGLTVTRRFRRGRRVAASCGQLGSAPAGPQGNAGWGEEL